MVDSILRRFEAYLDGHPSNPPKNILDVPTFFFALYSTFRDIALGLTVDYDQLWTERFQHDLAKQTVANDLINDVVGIVHPLQNPSSSSATRADARSSLLAFSVSSSRSSIGRSRP